MENSENTVKFTDAENKIRKRWLFWSTILPGFFLVIVALCCVFVSSGVGMMGAFLLFFLLSAGGLYLNYYCAYKNPGTILLILMMVGISLNLLATLFKPEDLVLMKESAGFSVFALLVLFFEFTVFYYSYKLRKINKKMQERKIIASPVYATASSVFSTATSLEELNEQFTKLRTPGDSGNTVEVLVKAYDRKKKMLKLINSSLND